MSDVTIRTDNSACLMCVNCAHCSLAELRGGRFWTCDKQGAPHDVLPYARACTEFRRKEGGR